MTYYFSIYTLTLVMLIYSLVYSFYRRRGVLSQVIVINILAYTNIAGIIYVVNNVTNLWWTNIIMSLLVLVMSILLLLRIYLSKSTSYVMRLLFLTLALLTPLYYITRHILKYNEVEYNEIISWLVALVINIIASAIWDILKKHCVKGC